MFLKTSAPRPSFSNTHLQVSSSSQKTTNDPNSRNSRKKSGGTEQEQEQEQTSKSKRTSGRRVNKQLEQDQEETDYGERTNKYRRTLATPIRGRKEVMKRSNDSDGNLRMAKLKWENGVRRVMITLYCAKPVRLARLPARFPNLTPQLNYQSWFPSLDGGRRMDILDKFRVIMDGVATSDGRSR